jgi:hypothetical protein
MTSVTTTAKRKRMALRSNGLRWPFVSRVIMTRKALIN